MPGTWIRRAPTLIWPRHRGAAVDSSAAYLTDSGALDTVMRRICDVFGSLLLLGTMLAPVMLVACLIKLESPGPVLYRQDRVGRYGRVFSLLKFRSMHVDAEADGPRW